MKSVTETELQDVALVTGRIARTHFLRGHTNLEGEQEAAQYLKEWFKNKGVKVVRKENKCQDTSLQ